MTNPFNLSTLNGNNGIVINEESIFDYSGTAVSPAGDINGDTIADIIIGAPKADSNGDDSGAGYVVFGGGEDENEDIIFSDGFEL